MTPIASVSVIAPSSRGATMARFYWDDTVKHDRPIITNCFTPGLARAAGLHPSSATEERDLDMLLTNIAMASQEERPLSYSRHRGHEYRGITFGRALSGVATIVKADLALERRTKPGHRGWQSVLRGTPILTDIFDRHGAEPMYEPRESIILRSRKDGSLLPLRPMRERQRQVDRVNEMLSGTLLGLELTGAIRLQNNLWLFERLEEDQFGNPRLVQQRLRLDRMTGHRVFTTDTEHHGRFYCPAQNIPSDERLMVTMNGEPVVELDIQSMHVALAHHLCGARLDGDPYEGMEGFTRKQVKLGMLTAFNATRHHKAVASLTDARGGRRVISNRNDAEILIEALKTRHAPIARMFCSDAGMELMNLDSRITLTGVDYLLAKGIPCTPIHDSLLVQERHEGEAREAMNFGWSEVLGKTRGQKLSLTPCSIEKKQPKVSHSGGAASVGGPSGTFAAGPGIPLSDGGDWWSSVLEEARLDVAEWAA
jgi:hypothetical protein